MGDAVRRPRPCGADLGSPQRSPRQRTQFAAALPEGPRDPAELLAAIEVCGDVASAVHGVDIVQENGPERLEVKRELYAIVEQHVGPGV